MGSGMSGRMGVGKGVGNGSEGSGGVGNGESGGVGGVKGGGGVWRVWASGGCCLGYDPQHRLTIPR